jgi:hypothetical protein
MRRALLVATSLVAGACGSSSDDDPSADDAGVAGDDAAVELDAASSTIDARPVDAGLDARPPIDAFPAVLDLRINCRNDCVLIANPAAINVPTGTEFEVNWINTGDTECDVAKIDQFNQVPIIIGLEPGTSYHDAVRRWCGQFTGTFNFRVSICTLHSYIPVDCSSP